MCVLCRSHAALSLASLESPSILICQCRVPGGSCQKRGQACSVAGEGECVFCTRRQGCDCPATWWPFCYLLSACCCRTSRACLQMESLAWCGCLAMRRASRKGSCPAARRLQLLWVRSQRSARVPRKRFSSSCVQGQSRLGEDTVQLRPSLHPLDYSSTCLPPRKAWLPRVSLCTLRKECRYRRGSDGNLNLQCAAMPDGLMPPSFRTTRRTAPVLGHWPSLPWWTSCRAQVLQPRKRCWHSCTPQTRGQSSVTWSKRCPIQTTGFWALTRRRGRLQARVQLLYLCCHELNWGQERFAYPRLTANQRAAGMLLWEAASANVNLVAVLNQVGSLAGALEQALRTRSLSGAGLIQLMTCDHPRLAGPDPTQVCGAYVGFCLPKLPCRVLVAHAGLQTRLSLRQTPMPYVVSWFLMTKWCLPLCSSSIRMVRPCW